MADNSTKTVTVGVAALGLVTAIVILAYALWPDNKIVLVGCQLTKACNVADAAGNVTQVVPVVSGTAPVGKPIQTTDGQTAPAMPVPTN